jgi:adenylate cyclase class 2
MAHGAHENEIKLKVSDVVSAKRMLYRAGFRVYKRRLFEDNAVFDTPQQALRGSDSLLRLRVAGGQAVVTFKGKQTESKHKSREELETKVADAAMTRRIFERLGFEQRFRYQKYRTEYKQPGKSGVATLDETPIGVYVELEGAPDWIDRTAKRLGFSESDYITLSYGRLYLEFCETRRRKPGDMVW